MRRDNQIHSLIGQEIKYLLMSIFFIAALLSTLFALVTHAQNTRYRAFLTDLVAEGRIQATEFEGAKLTSQGGLPSIIKVSEDDVILFDLGSAELTPAFSNYLTVSVVPVIRQAKDRITLVQVVGHTDQTRVSANGKSNLDDMIIKFNRAEIQASAFSYGSNVDLGYVRAAAVVEALRAQVNDVQFVAYSAGQSLNTDNTAATGLERKEDKSRRRIEIYLRGL